VKGPVNEPALPTVSLAEVNGAAALLTRVDRKYVLPTTDLPGLLARLVDEVPGSRVLAIDGRTTHGYRSVYFDTPELLSFHMAARPRRRRFKLRTRTYLDSGESFLEFKAVGPRGLTVKSRLALTVPGATVDDRLPPDAASWADDLLAETGTGVTATALSPVLWGGYDRTTFLLPDGTGRATVDTALTWHGRDTPVLERPGMAVVETKSGTRPSPVDRLLWRAGHRPAKISKFGTGMAALYPTLPRNRWTRVLRTYF
jgi:hypothetical protein